MLALAGMLVAARSAAAQPPTPSIVEDHSPRRRDECRRAARLLIAGSPAERRDWALGVIDGCERTGPDALAAVWRAPLAADARERVLARSTRLRDARLFTAARAAAANTARSAPDRVAALRLLAMYARPWIWATPDMLEPRADGDIYAVPVASTSDAPDAAGVEPLPANTAVLVRDLMRTLSSDPDTRVQWAARYFTWRLGD